MKIGTFLGEFVNIDKDQDIWLAKLLIMWPFIIMWPLHAISEKGHIISMGEFPND
jgi:hypothetical protein